MRARRRLPAIDQLLLDAPLPPPLLLAHSRALTLCCHLLVCSWLVVISLVHVVDGVQRTQDVTLPQGTCSASPYPDTRKTSHI